MRPLLDIAYKNSERLVRLINDILDIEKLESGRLVRLLSTLMAVQAGLPALDYGAIAGRGKRGYIAAIHAAQGRDYGPMEQVFRKILRRTLGA